MLKYFTIKQISLFCNVNKNSYISFSDYLTVH